MKAEEALTARNETLESRVADEIKQRSRAEEPGERLRDLGYDVIEARDASSALAALMEVGRVDLLFTDVVLPGGKTGADLAREARKLQPDIKVLFTTGYARSALDRERNADRASSCC